MPKTETTKKITLNEMEVIAAIRNYLNANDVDGAYDAHIEFVIGVNRMNEFSGAIATIKTTND